MVLGVSPPRRILSRPGRPGRPVSRRAAARRAGARRKRDVRAHDRRERPTGRRAALEAEQARQSALLAQSGLAGAPHPVQQLVLAADQFVVARPTEGDGQGQSVIAGYPWFSDWGRDTMIAPARPHADHRRPDVAGGILRTFARFVDQGMLPNRFPDAGETPEYNTVDATLWYFEAVARLRGADRRPRAGPRSFPVLADIMQWHVRGTRYGIRVDEHDGLLAAGEPGVQLTWMDAKVGDWVVTPRIGKPVEVNALWINALRIMQDLDSASASRSATAAVWRAGGRATASFWAASGTRRAGTVRRGRRPGRGRRHSAAEPVVRGQPALRAAGRRGPARPSPKRRGSVRAAPVDVPRLAELAPDEPAYIGTTAATRARATALITRARCGAG